MVLVVISVQLVEKFQLSFRFVDSRIPFGFHSGCPSFYVKSSRHSGGGGLVESLGRGVVLKQPFGSGDEISFGGLWGICAVLFYLGLFRAADYISDLRWVLIVFSFVGWHVEAEGMGVH